jgi:hypothetical protein
MILSMVLCDVEWLCVGVRGMLGSVFDVWEYTVCIYYP